MDGSRVTYLYIYIGPDRWNRPKLLPNLRREKALQLYNYCKNITSHRKSLENNKKKKKEKGNQLHVSSAQTASKIRYHVRKNDFKANSFSPVIFTLYSSYPGNKVNMENKVGLSS